MKELKLYIEEKPFSFKGFLQFLKENTMLVLISALTIFLVYGAKLTTICFGVDTEHRIATQGYLNWLQIGRFGLVALQKLWCNFLPNKELFNPYLSVIFGCMFLFLAALLWCFLLEVFSGGFIKKIAYIPFVIMFISHQVWTEQIYFALQSAECLFITFASPIAVYAMFLGTVKKDIKRITLGVLLAVFCTSVYQGVFILICCGICAVFVLFKENTKLESKEYTRICITLFALMLVCAMCYFILNKIIQMILQVEKSDYLLKMVGNDRKSVKWAILNIGVYIYKLVFAHCTVISRIAEPIMARAARTGWKAVEQIRESSLMANILILPAVIAYIFFVLKSEKKSVLYIAAAFCVPLSCFVLVLIGGGDAPLRSQYVLPFAIGFVMMYGVSRIKGEIFFKLAVALFLLCGIKQVFVCSMLNYSDVMRYKADVRLSNYIAQKIKEVNTNEDIPVFLYGVYHPRFAGNYIKGEVCGYSSFEWDNGVNLTDSTSRGIDFMKTQGYNFSPVKLEDTQLIEKARLIGETMSDFPSTDSVKNVGDVVVVRLSESSYKDKNSERQE